MRGRKRVRPGAERFTKPVKQKGIPLSPSHDPFRTTVVCCRTYQDYTLFCQACEVSSSNRKMICLSEAESRLGDKLRGISDCEAVFLGGDPREPFPTFNSMFHMESLRQRGWIKHAYVYKEWSFEHIEPQIAQDGAREW